MYQIISSSRQTMSTLVRLVILTVVLNLTIVPQTTARLAGDLWLTGAVTLNGTAVTSGIAVFNNSQIKTARSSSATVNLGKLGRIKIEPESELVLQFAQGLIGGNQVSGLAAISANKGIKSKVSTPHVLVEADGTEVGLVSIDVKPEYTCVVANRGAVRLTAGQKVSYLNQGEALSFNARGLEKPGHCEGLRSASLAKPIAVGAGLTAASLIPLTRSAISSVQGGSVTPTTTGSQVTGQSSPPPTATATNNPTTPVKPPAAFTVCNCKYDKDQKPLAASQNVTLCHVLPNGNRNNLTVTCASLLTHFNLNGTPRAGHEGDVCGNCQ